MKKVAFLSCVLMALPAFGQTVHKCPGPDGKIIYKQTECGGGITGDMKVETGKPSNSRQATAEELEQCLRLIKVGNSWKDPDSVKVEGEAFVRVFPSGRKEIIFEVNAKNSYGAYIGAKPAYCKFKANGDLDEVKAF